MLALINKFRILVVLFFSIFSCFASEKIGSLPYEIGGSKEKLPTEFPLLYDVKYSPYFGASMVESAYSVYSFIWPHAGYSSFFISNPYNPLSILERAVHAYVDYEYVAQILRIMNHEALGHGFRLREADVGEVKISMFSAIPKDPTQLQHLKDTLSPAEFAQREISVHIGGIETSDVLAKTRTLNFLRKNRITPGDALLYIQALQDGLFYIRGSSDYGNVLPDVITLAEIAKNPVDEGNEKYDQNYFPANVYTLWINGYLDDIRNYAHKINELYGSDEALSVAKIQDQAIISYFDPYIYYSLYYLAVEYVIKGNLQWKYPMIPLGKDIGYLPGLKLIMTPYGLEKQLISYVRYKNNSMRMYMNYGKTLNIQSYGLGFDINPININGYLSVGGKFYLWRQPKLFTPEPAKAKLTNGFLLQGNSEYKIHKHITTMLNLGYKTKGFSQGSVLDSSIIFEAGFKIVV